MDEDGGIVADSGKSNQTLAVGQQRVQQEAKGVVFGTR